jgi:hypothetical protein
LLPGTAIALQNAMRVWNPEEVPTNVALDPAKGRARELLVPSRPAYVASAVPGNEEACGCTVVRHRCGVDRHESAVLIERCFRSEQKPQSALVVKVVEHAESQD